MKGAPPVRPPLLVAAGLLFIAFNLRLAIAAVSPVLPEIRRTDGLSAPVAGLLTTLPLLCFGLLSPLAPRLIRRIGPGRLLLFCLAGIASGIALRSVPPVWTLFVGTVLLGASLAVANVLMPGVVKSRFATNIGLATGLYTTMIDVGIAVSAGITVPITRALGGDWRLAIGVWALVALVALAIWTGFLHLDLPDAAPVGAVVPAPGVWRSPSAWWITAYMGLQSFNFFTVLAWLPTLLRTRGLSAATAGGVLSVVGLVAIPAALLFPVLGSRMRDFRVATCCSTGAIALGLGGLLLVHHGLEVLWAVLLGIGQGSSLSLALILMVVRARDSSHAIAVSGMAQGLGYLLASAGPTAIGAVEVASGGWSVPLTVLLVLAGGQVAAGWVAALPEGVSRSTEPAR